MINHVIDILVSFLYDNLKKIVSNNDLQVKINKKRIKLKQKVKVKYLKNQILVKKKIIIMIIILLILKKLK